jgi:hypothetical protein
MSRRKATIIWDIVGSEIQEAALHPIMEIEYNEDSVEAVLASAGRNWSFDIWFVFNTWGKDVTPMATTIFKRYTFPELLSYDHEIVPNFFTLVEDAYQKNPYHNSRHA